jgi:hypothetical protein
MSDSTEARKWVRARLKEGVDAATIKKQLEAGKHGLAGRYTAKLTSF